VSVIRIEHTEGVIEIHESSFHVVGSESSLRIRLRTNRLVLTALICTGCHVPFKNRPRADEHEEETTDNQ
jgi:hypothetical protein